MAIFNCPNCGFTFEKIEVENLCPGCNTTIRFISCHDTLNIEFKELIIKKIKVQGVKDPVYEMKFGDDVCKDTGEWMEITQIVDKRDRKNKKYYKMVKNPKTGEVIRLCQEPLEKHQGYGSAKHKKTKKKD